MYSSSENYIIYQLMHMDFMRFDLVKGLLIDVF